VRTFLMCGGRGERLGELTKDKPKCLVEIGGKTMLDRWLNKFDEWKFSDVLINMNYCSDKIMDYLKGISWNKMRVTLSSEKELLGTARTLYENRRFVKGEYCFGVVYADVWTTFDMRKMISFHKRRPGMITLGLYENNTFEGKGVCVVKDGLVVGFEEKPQIPKSKYIWGGILVAHPSIFSVIDAGMVDIANDLLPKLVKVGMVSAFYIDQPLVDMGTAEGYKKANELSRSLGFEVL